MYYDYFGLKAPPFTIAPDPRYLYMSERHREALAHLLYAFQGEGAFVLLTGEVGTGKTTICRALLAQLPENSDVALVLNPRLGVGELLATICDELGVTHPEHRNSLKAWIDVLNAHLLAAHAQGRNTVLLIDEAQNLSAKVLEQLRLLTNLETTTRKLLQIVLVGQPELRALLAKPELRQLAQRITARYHIEPLRADELPVYVEHRLEVAGARNTLFERSCFAPLYRASGGIPRLINSICDRALLGAYAEHRRLVDARMIRRAAGEVLGSDPGRRPAWLWPAVAGGLAGIAAIAVLAWWLGHESGRAVVAAPAEAEPIERPAIVAGNLPAPVPGAITAVAAEIPQSPAPAAVPAATATGSDGGVSSAPIATTLDWAAVRRPDAAFRAVLERWQVEAGGVDAERPCAAVEAAGLACLEAALDYDRLLAHDRPAVLHLYAADGGDGWLALLGADERNVTLGYDGERLHWPRERLATAWFGDAQVIWRPAPGGATVVAAGDAGEGVRWLQTTLVALGATDVLLDAGRFGDATRAAVIAFQQQHGLTADGIVGPRTIMRLRAVRGDAGPRLGEG
ncbi:MAG: AAA family ATPase [Chromatiales bacterium]|nr:AAA family ATPase [Chromatiales bacterium]